MSMGIIAVSSAALGAGVSIYATNKNARIAKDAATDARTERDVQRAELEKEMQAYRNMEIKNPFEGMQNMFAENVYEDLTVNQQQAQFQAQQGAQQRANIMQNLQGAAGGSGIAGLAQALANQGQLQTQQISASIGQQEARNQALRAQGALQVQRGAADIQSLERQGAQYVQQAEMDRQATLLSMQMGETTGTNLAYQQAQANQMQAQIAQNQALASGFTNIASTAVGAYQEELFPNQS